MKKTKTYTQVIEGAKLTTKMVESVDMSTVDADKKIAEMYRKEKK